jgi:hypothetical protein
VEALLMIQKFWRRGTKRNPTGIIYQPEQNSSPQSGGIKLNISFSLILIAIILVVCNGYDAKFYLENAGGDKVEVELNSPLNYQLDIPKGEV